MAYAGEKIDIGNIYLSKLYLFQQDEFRCNSIQRIIISRTSSRSSWVKGRFCGIRCHFSRQTRQQVAVACCATNTEYPRIGVCFPSFIGVAQKSFFSNHCSALPRSSPLESCTFAISKSLPTSLNLERNFDLASL